MSLYLFDFRLARPPYEHDQESILKWLGAVHARAEAKRNPSVDSEDFKKRVTHTLTRLGLGESKAKRRGTIMPDVAHTEWEKMELFHLSVDACMSRRMALFGKAVNQFFEDFYPEDEILPPDLIHVTCTGYLSPSGAQKLVASRNAGSTTTVTHAYHMGCYAAIPAIRMASGFALKSQKRADIVHTELCTLHMDPHTHTPEQLVIQSLFADGCVRYSVSSQCNTPSLAVLGLKEATLPATAHAMTWAPASWGMQMGLKKEVPQLIEGSLEGVIEDLAKECGFMKADLLKSALFAIHPGGSKIIDAVATRLKLEKKQCIHSYKVMENYGNMSSATLPYIWESILNDDAIPSGTLIISFAFGPGLTIATSLMKKALPC